MSKRVITFGEIMLRLAPEGYNRFVQAETYNELMEAAKQMLQFLWLTSE
jgi:hypothetical protein